ncbi:MAG: sodium:solute symporter [Planctomycetota bacterium]
MGWLDWTIVAGFLALLLGLSFTLSRASKSTADFMAAGRSAGRFILSMANDMGGFAAIFVVATFEQFYVSGFPGAWWSTLLMPMWAIIMFSGWIQYRFRETRALTMPHFFAERYSPRVRIWAGVLAFIAGVLNYGIFPGVTANLLVAFCGLPVSLDVFGFAIPTALPVMLAVLTIAMIVLLTGGLVSVMVTDFLQGLLVIFGTLAIAVFFLWAIGWDTFFEGATVAGAGESKVDPFDQSEIRSFNVWFFLILATNRFYSFMAFPTRQGYDAAALSPDEARFSRMLGDWMFNVRNFVIMLIPIGAWVVMHHVDFTDTAAAVNEQLALLPDEQTQTQMRVPVVLAQLLPIGLMGLFVAMMIGAAVSTDNTFVHSWGSIFVHDVVEPLRKKPLTERVKLKLLRLAMFGVAAFAVFWSLIFPVQEYIFMYFQLTSSLYVGAAGALVIGGLYWRRGTTQGAWAALIIGPVIAVSGIVLRLLWPSIPALSELSESFPINGVWMFFIAMTASIIGYVGVSLVTCREPVDLDRLLNRTPEQRAEHGDLPETHSIFDLKRFALGSRLTVVLYLGYVGLLIGVFIVGIAVSSFTELPTSLWVGYWKVFVVFGLIVAAIMAVTFLLGGIGDIRRLRAHLAGQTRSGSELTQTRV